MRPFRTENARDGADGLHRLGGGDGDVELHPAALDLGHHVLEAGEIGAGIEGDLRVCR